MAINHDFKVKNGLDVGENIKIDGTVVVDTGGEIITAQLKDSGVTAGTYGDSSNIPQITVDGKGRVTEVTDVSVTIANDFLDGLSFNTSDGILTASVGSQADVTVDLDGRYQLAGNYDNYGSWIVSDGNSAAGVFSGQQVNFEGSGATDVTFDSNTKTFTISSTDTDNNYFVTGANFSDSTGILTLNRTNPYPSITVDMDGRYELIGTNDNYTSWTASDGTTTAAVTSGETVTFTGSGATSVSFNSTSQTYTISSTDNNDNDDTTYSIALTDGAAGEVDIDLTAGGSGSGTDSVTLKQGSNVSLSRSGDVVTISSTDTNTDTTYTAGTGLSLSGTQFNANVNAAVQTTAASAVTTNGARTYAVQVDGSDNLVVNVPWSDTNTETTTSLSLSGDTLTYTDETGTANDISLSKYIDDTNLARLTSGSLDGTTGIATFTRDDSSTFTVDFSEFLASGSSFDGTFDGTINATRLRLTASDDASLSSTLHALQIGSDAGQNLILDNNEIHSRTNGAISTLFLNGDGGEVKINGNLATNTSFLNGQIISTSNNTGSEPYVQLKVINTGTSAGIKLHSQTTSGKNYEIQSDISGDLIVYDRDAQQYRLRLNANGVDAVTGGLRVGGTTVIDSDHNATLDKATIAGKIQLEPDDSYSGYYTVGFQGVGTGNGVNKIFAHGTGGDGLYICSASSRNINFRTNGGTANTFIMTASGDFRVGETTVIDDSRNITGASITGSSLTVNGSGQYVAGSIYSDSNWGMIFRAKQASPTNAQFRWADSADSELMRVDNSGNLLVGTTDVVVWDNSSNTSSDNGHNLRKEGRAGFSYYNATKNANSTVNINRTGSDGDLIRLFRSGVRYGSIGISYGSEPYFASNDAETGILLNSNGVIPVDGNGLATNGTRDLGQTSNKWKDLHLSGIINSAGVKASGDLHVLKAEPKLILENTEETDAEIIFNDYQAGGYPAASSQAFKMRWSSDDNIFRMGHDNNSYNNFSMDAGGNITGNGRYVITKGQHTSATADNAHIKLLPSSTTNTTGLTSVMLGTSTSSTYGVSLNGARKGTDGAPTFTVRMHNGINDGVEHLALNSSGALAISGGMTMGDGSGQSYLRIGDQVADNNTGGWNKGVHLNANAHGRFRIRTTASTYGALETYFWADSTVTPSVGIYGNTSTFRFNGSITTLQNKDGATYWHSGSFNPSNYLSRVSTDHYTPKRLDMGSSTSWDSVGFGSMTNLHFQDHNQFWVGAGNGTWFKGTANTKDLTGGISADASVAHDLLITTMQSLSTYDRGITFAVDNTGAGTSGWRLGKWHSGAGYGSSMLTVDGQLRAKGSYTDEADYYSDDYSTYWDDGQSHWVGDTNAGWHKPSIVASSAIQIQSGNTGTNTRKPQIQFHQYGYGGPGIEYDGPNKVITVGELGTSTADRFNHLKIKTNDGYLQLGPQNTSHCHIQTDRSNFYFNNELRVDSGLVGSYNEDLNLNRAQSTTARIRVTDGTTYSDQNMRVSSNLGVNAEPRTDVYRLNMGGNIHMNNYQINYVDQLHFNDNVRFYDDGNDNYLNFKWGDPGAGGIKFVDGSGNLHGYVYGDSDTNFGLLDKDGQWAIRVVHDSYVELRDNNEVTFRAGQGGVEGNYGTVQTYSAGKEGWGGYSINGRVVFMHDVDANSWGIYNDVNNEWMIYGDLNGKVDLRYNSTVKLQTTSTGVEVVGLLTATQKSFTIDHPTKEGKKLRYGSLEGPENGVYVRGRLKGDNVIELPECWTGLVHEDSITVDLTPIGRAHVWVEDLDGYTVTVGSDAEEVNCFYVVYGERKDVDKLEVEFDA